MKYLTKYCVDCDLDFMKDTVNSDYCSICGKILIDRTLYFML